MTTLQLDVAQRVNLIAMLDQVEAHGRREVWAICRLQDQLRLSDEEKEYIGWRTTIATNGVEYAQWNPNNGARDLKPFELDDGDVKRVCQAVDQSRIIPSRDRIWWEPLVKQLPDTPEPKAAA